MRLPEIPRFPRPFRRPTSGRRVPRPQRFRHRLGFEMLEDRTLLSVTFTPGPLTVPVTSGADTALGAMSGFRPVEPFTSVNPVNPGQVAVSTHSGLRVSTNGGATFTSGTAFPGSTGGDTGTVYDHAGRLFWVNITSVGLGIVQVNPTTGAVITGPFTVDNGGTADDKPFIAADPNNNNLYVIWTALPSTGSQVLIRRSTNQGVSWSAAVRVDNGADGFVWPAAVGVATNGFVYASYHSVLGFSNNNPDHSGKIVAVRLNNDLTGPVRTLAQNQGFSDITFNVQTSGSARVIPRMQFWIQGGGQPQVLPDPARPGNVYIISADSISTTNDQMDIRIARSTNNGASWTSSIIVSPGGTSFAMFPQAAIDQFGDIVVAWYDNRRGLTNGAGRYKLDVFAKYSRDGGVTFSPEFMVNQASNPFDPDIGAVNRFAGPPPTTRIGEYFGIALHGGTAYVAWNGDLGTSSEQVFFKSFAIRGSLTVTGTSGNDTVTIANTSGNNADVDVTVNGQRQYTGLWAALSGITLTTTAGLDTTNVENVAAGTPVTVNMSTGGATVNISPTAHNLSNVQAAVTVVGNAGVDTLNVNDQGNSANQTYTLTATSVARTGAAAISFGSLMNFVSLNGGGGANTYNVTGTGGINVTTLNTGNGNDVANVETTSSGRALTINAGAGTDTVSVSPTARNLGNVLGVLTVNGGGGTDTLVLNDQNNSANQTYALTATSVTRSGAAAINFNSSLRFITLNGGSGANTYNVTGTGAASGTTLATGNGNDTVNVEGTNAARALTVNEGAGNDTANVSPTAQNLNALQGALTVNGNTGFDTLTVNDQNNAAAVTYTTTATTLARTGSATITVGGQLMNVVTLNGGGGADTYNVGDTADAFVVTTLNGGGGGNTYNVNATTFPLVLNFGTGSDTANVSPTAQNLNALQGALTVNGNTGFATLTLNDQNNAAATTYSLGTTTLSRPGAAAITVGGQLMNVVTLNGGGGADTYNVGDTADAFVVTTLNGGGGGNTYNVNATTFPLVLNFGTGTDTAVVSSSAQSLDTIQGALTVNGNSGFATLTLNDQNDAAAVTYTVTATTLARTNAALVTIGGQGMNVVNLNGGGGADTYDLDGTGAATTVVGGAGGNVFHVSPFTQYLAASLVGPLTLTGGGADILEFFDANDPNSETFSFDAVPASLTLGSTGTDVTDFTGMGGGVYGVTNGFSTPNDQSGTVIFDPSGGPPSGQGNGPSTQGTRVAPEATLDRHLLDSLFASDGAAHSVRTFDPSGSRSAMPQQPDLGSGLLRDLVPGDTELTPVGLTW